MWLAKWWTPDTIFVTVVGAAMAMVMGGSFFARTGSTSNGSALVPPSVLQSVRAHEVECQTITGNDDDIMAVALRTRC
jgi:hypothetical protein